MDKITKKFRNYHDECSRRIDDEGTYLPHQSLYGFSAWHVENFTRAFAITRVMDGFDFNTFLEVGCAEGYFPNVVKKRYGVTVIGSDFSFEAVCRMKDIFTFDGCSADGADLPFKDNSVDMVLCTEVLEHMTRPREAARELIRVARKQLIVTVPAANNEKEQKEFKPDYELIRDGHLHLFTKEDLKEMFGDCVIIGCDSRRMKYINAGYRRLGKFLPSIFAGIVFNLDRVLSKKAKNVRHFIVIKTLVPSASSKKYSSLTRFLTRDVYKDVRKVKLGVNNKHTFMGYTIADR